MRYVASHYRHSTLFSRKLLPNWPNQDGKITRQDLAVYTKPAVEPEIEEDKSFLESHPPSYRGNWFQAALQERGNHSTVQVGYGVTGMS